MDPANARPSDRHAFQQPAPLSPPHTARLLRLLLLALTVSLSGCGVRGTGGDRAAPVPDPGSRPDDGLLRDPELQGLVDLQVERDGQALVERLDDPDPRVRARAAFALGSVQDRGAVASLSGLLRDPVASVRADAAFALGVASPPDGSPAAGVADSLAAGLERENDPAARRTLLDALARTGAEEHLVALLETAPPESDTAHADAPAFAAALARFGIRGIHTRDAVTWLLSAIHASAPDLREEAAYYFGRIPEPRFWMDRASAVREALDGYAPDDPAAMHLLRALGTAGDPLDQERVVSWIDGSPDWRIRTSAAQAATAWRTGEPIRDALFEALSDSSSHVALSAAQALTQNVRLSEEQLDRVQAWVEENRQRWRVVPPLLSALGSAGRSDILFSWLAQWPEDAVPPRTAALEALAYVEHPRVDPVLLEAAASGTPAVAVAALRALTRRWRVLRTSRDRDVVESYFETFAGALRSGNPAAVAEVAPVLVDPLLRPLGGTEVLVEEARRMEMPGDLESLTAIVEALAWVQEDRDRVEPVLREALESRYPPVREAAARSLTALTGQRVPVPDAAPAPAPSVDWRLLAELGPRPRLILDTEEGRIVLVLDAEEAPLTVATVAGYASAGRYDDVPFHRVLPNFVVQGGDFVREDGTGSPDTVIRTELTRVPFDAGAIGMASAGRDTEGSQFYITHSKQDHLEGGYTSFGRVVEGMDVVGRIDEGERLLRATVEPGER